MELQPYYQDSHCTIYHGDCRNIMPMLDKVDLVLTDPPYGYGWDTNYSRFSKGSRDKQSIANDKGEIDVLEILKKIDEQIVWGANCIGLNPPCGLLVWDKRCADGWSFLSDGEAASWNKSKGIYIFSKNGQQARSEAGMHPTQKPVALMSWCIGKSKSSGTVLDPFMGSGTTLVAAKLEGRRAIGIEIDEKYCEIAANRLRQGVLFG